VNFELIPVVIITIAALVTFLVTLYNFFYAPIVGRGAFLQEAEPLSKVSILIPARNEENNIGNCLESCLNQDYTNLEIIVLDDHSEDRTAEVVMAKTLVDPRVRLLKGKELPPGWLGKNWACHQMGGIATGEYLLFIDADVTLGKGAVSRVVSTVKSNKIGMFSVFPTQILSGTGATIVIPVMNWLLLNFLPLRQVFQSDSPKFVAANGQFILFSKETYQKTGGHATVKGWWLRIWNLLEM
jgi:cellulose synthase/poly-beta-1,6-N-acetylglucosamine synthase-like glycosyltransferase